MLINDLNTKKYLQWKMGQKTVDIEVSKVKLLEKSHRRDFNTLKQSQQISNILPKLQHTTKLHKPIVVRQLKDGTYRLIVGLKGYILSTILNHKMIPCIMVQDAHWKSFVFRINKMPLDCERVMSIDDITVPKPMLKTKPSPTKIQACLDYYKKNFELDKSITIDERGVLRNGYVRYIVSKMKSFNHVPVKFA